MYGCRNASIILDEVLLILMDAVTFFMGQALPILKTENGSKSEATKILMLYKFGFY
jgi:hypothetical protein